MKSLHVIAGACTVLGVLVFASCKSKPHITTPSMDDKADGRPPEAFAELGKDVFPGMDGGVQLTDDEIKGRNSWNLWCGGETVLGQDGARRIRFVRPAEDDRFARAGAASGRSAG